MSSDTDDTDIVPEFAWPDILTLVAAFFLLRVGTRMWTMTPADNFAAATLIIYTYGLALFFIFLAVSWIDIEPYGHYLAALALISIIGGGLLLWWFVERPYLGTDVMFFTQEAAELVKQGQNPYTADLSSALDQYDLNLDDREKTAFITPRTNGRAAISIVYPAGAFLVLLPQLLLSAGRPQPLLSFAIPSIVVLVLLVRYSPPPLALLGLLVGVAPRNLVIGALGGINDGLWLLPIIITMVLWYHDRITLAGITYGVACAIKQQPWLMAPFLGYWLLASADSPREMLRRPLQFFTPASLVFLAVNLPWILASPRAWAYSILRPLQQGAAPLVTQGTGLALWTATGSLSITQHAYTLVFAAWGVTLGALYVIYFDSVKWTAWIMPGIVLFAAHRSLPTYFYFMVPPAYIALLARYDLLYKPGEIAPRPTRTIQEVTRRWA